MISSRRLAREWALRILYQKDVGKSTLEEALDSALERLRLEFVQRGSRHASGSDSEQVCLDYITRELSPLLRGLEWSSAIAAADVAAGLMAEAPRWQELRLERVFKSQFRGVPLVPPCLLQPPLGMSAPEKGSIADSRTGEQQGRLSAFTAKSREDLPQLLEPDLRKEAMLFVNTLSTERPIAASPEDVQRFLLSRRTAYNQIQIERWGKVGEVIRKQVGDWLRTAGFTLKLVVGAAERCDEIDDTISTLSAGWSLERQVAVDRNILRLAGYEIMFLPGVPTGVAINEAVDLAKKYSTTESGRFVNGVLGALATYVAANPIARPPDTTGGIESHENTLDLADISVLDEID